MTVDISAVLALVKRARAEFSRIPARMLNAARTGAALARADHDYHNRTGDAEKSTRAVLDRGARGDTSVTLEIDVPYASFIRKSSHIDSAAAKVEDQIQAELEAIAERIAK